MAHAIWAGAITFGLVTIPVKLYSAIRAHELHFNYLHREDGGRIRYQRVCEACGKKVAWKDIARGFEHGRDDYVVLEDDDFRKAAPEASREVQIVQFVDLVEIDPVLFDVPYYLAPERRGRHAYALLREALAKSGKVGIARVVLRTREHLAALKPSGRALVIELMHWSDEVVAPGDLDFPEQHPKLPAAEMKMAMSLIGTMDGRFEPDAFRDEYRDKLLGLIDARSEGRQPPRETPRARAPGKVVDLARLLEQSLSAAKKRAPARKTARRHAA